MDAHDIEERCIGLFERGFDVAKALISLRFDVVRDLHRVVIEAGCAGDKDCVPDKLPSTATVRRNDRSQ